MEWAKPLEIVFLLCTISIPSVVEVQMTRKSKLTLDEILAAPLGEELPEEALSRIVGGVEQIDDSVASGDSWDMNRPSTPQNDGTYQRAWPRRG